MKSLIANKDSKVGGIVKTNNTECKTQSEKKINYGRLKRHGRQSEKSTTCISEIVERENKETKIETIMSENFPKLMKNIILQI